MKNFLSRFVDTNEREVRRLRPILDEINGLEPELQALSDEELRERMVTLREPSCAPRRALRAVRGGARVRGRAASRAGQANDARTMRGASRRRSTTRCRRSSRPFARSAADASRCGHTTSRSWAPWSCTRARSRRCAPARARPSSAPSPPRSTRWAAEASTWSPSTTTWPSATRSGWAPSSTVSA